MKTRITILLAFSLIAILYSCQKDKNEQINPELVNPKANFEIVENKVGVVEFNNTSSDAKTYSWNFGDETYSSEINPTHQYLSNGNFEVILIAKNETLSDTFSITVEVNDLFIEEWNNIGTFDGELKSQSIYFRLGNKYYVGFGEDHGSGKNELWELDIESNKWIRKNDTPDEIIDGVCFVINDVAYAGLGEGYQIPNCRMWKYDSENDSWSRIADFPGYDKSYTYFTGATSFSLNGLGYVLNGKSYVSDVGEFWSYNPQNDIWQQLSDFPGEPRHQSASFVLNDKLYLFGGAETTDNMRFYNDLWEFNPENELWSKKANLPSNGRIGAVGFSLKDKGYIGLGWESETSYANQNTEYFSDLWEYNQVENKWTQKLSFPDVTRVYPFVLSFDSYVLIGTGMGDFGRGKSDIWEYRLQ